MEDEPQSLRSSRVLATQEILDKLADRIERAYGLRRPQCWLGCSTRRVWFAAALRLWEAHSKDPLHVPLDAELFVASQPVLAAFPDPWTELTQPEAACRYRCRVRRIVRQLVRELKAEIGRARRLIRRGRDMETVLCTSDERISALGRYIVAQRAGRGDLASRFANSTAAQYRACPLYRRATAALLPGSLDPIERLACSMQPPLAPAAGKIALSLN